MDHERPLNKRGRNDAPFMGQILRRKGISLDGLYVSPAIRALATARLIASEIHLNPETILEKPEIYENDEKQLLLLLQTQIPDHQKTIGLVGHNPAISGLVNLLTKSENAALDFPTCGMALINFEVESWNALEEGIGTLSFFEYPKKHRL